MWFFKKASIKKTEQALPPIACEVSRRFIEAIHAELSGDDRDQFTAAVIENHSTFTPGFELETVEILVNEMESLFDQWGVDSSLVEAETLTAEAKKCLSDDPYTAASKLGHAVASIRCIHYDHVDQGIALLKFVASIRKRRAEKLAVA